MKVCRLRDKAVSRDYGRWKYVVMRGRCYKDGDTTSRTLQLCMELVSFNHVSSAHIFILSTKSVCYSSVSALLALLTLSLHP